MGNVVLFQCMTTNKINKMWINFFFGNDTNRWKRKRKTSWISIFDLDFQASPKWCCWQAGSRQQLLLPSRRRRRRTWRARRSCCHSCCCCCNASHWQLHNFFPKNIRKPQILLSVWCTKVKNNFLPTRMKKSEGPTLSAFFSSPILSHSVLSLSATT